MHDKKEIIFAAQTFFYNYGKNVANLGKNPYMFNIFRTIKQIVTKLYIDTTHRLESRFSFCFCVLNFRVTDENISCKV